jgi:hypothetical protein
MREQHGADRREKVWRAGQRLKILRHAGPVTLGQAGHERFL